MMGTKIRGFAPPSATSRSKISSRRIASTVAWVRIWTSRSSGNSSPRSTRGAAGLPLTRSSSSCASATRREPNRAQGADARWSALR